MNSPLGSCPMYQHSKSGFFPYYLPEGPTSRAPGRRVCPQYLPGAPRVEDPAMHPAYPSPGQSPPQGAHQHSCEPIQQGRSSSLTFAIVFEWVERPERWPVDIFFPPAAGLAKLEFVPPCAADIRTDSGVEPPWYPQLELPISSTRRRAPPRRWRPGMLGRYPVRQPGAGGGPRPWRCTGYLWGLDRLGSPGIRIPGQVPPHHPGRGPGRRRCSSGAWKDKLTRSGRLGGEVIPDRRLALEQDDLVHRRGWEDFGGAKPPTRRATVTLGGQWRNSPRKSPP